MTDRYAVFGNPIAHSKSPAIHAAFAAQTGESMSYEALLAPVDGFADAISSFMAEGGKGANVTIPFKEEAFRLCHDLSSRAWRAGAVNTLIMENDRIHGDNTDGIGLIRDVEVNLGFPLAGRRILLLGAGGAARGVLGPLLKKEPASLVVANRTLAKAESMATGFADVGTVGTCSFEALSGQCFDVLINATSASLGGEALTLPSGLFTSDCLVYDMMYSKEETPFMIQARAAGAVNVSDGLGMLVEQAAEAFFLWRSVRPETRTVLASLRAG